MGLRGLDGTGMLDGVVGAGWNWGRGWSHGSGWGHGGWMQPQQLEPSVRAVDSQPLVFRQVWGTQHLEMQSCMVPNGAVAPWSLLDHSGASQLPFACPTHLIQAPLCGQLGGHLWVLLLCCCGEGLSEGLRVPVVLLVPAHLWDRATPASGLAA